MPRKTFPEPQKYKSEGVVIGFMARWRTPDGKRPYKLFPFAAFGDDHAKAYDAAKAELERQIGERRAYKDGTKTFIAVDDMTLGQFYKDHWLPERNARKNQPEDDKSIWSTHLVDVFANTPLKALQDPVPINRFKASIQARCEEPATARKVMALLMAMLNHAADTGYLASVPRIKRIKIQKKGFNILQTDKEIDAFLGRAGTPEHFAVWAVAVYSGMRAGEIVALRWRDINLDAGRIIVRRSNESPTTKSGEPRKVPILVKLAPVLKAWKELTRDADNPMGLVFPSPAGAMYRVDTSIFKKHYHAALIGAGLEAKEAAKDERMRFHDLRHTMASNFLSNGGTLQELKEILGHSSLQVTEMYAHFVPDSFRGAAGSFALVSPKSQEPPPPEPKPEPKAPPKIRGKRSNAPPLRLVK